MTEESNELALPVRGGWTGDPQMDARLKRNFRRIEEWAGSPHRVYGSRMISPQYYAEDETNHVFTCRGTLIPGFAGIGFDRFVGITLEIDRRQRAFIIGGAEVDNTDLTTDYNTAFFLPVDVGSTLLSGNVLANFLVHGAPGRQQVWNMRNALIDVTEKTTVKFGWGYRQSASGNQNCTVYRQKLLLALYDAPDIQANGEIVWTRSTVNKAAYRTAETDDV